MIAVRRVYLVIVLGVSLGMLIGGLMGLGDTLISSLLAGQPFGAGVRTPFAVATAAALIGLIGWTLHWRWAQRLAAADSSERASTLRRLFLYATLAVLAIAMAFAA